MQGQKIKITFPSSKKNSQLICVSVSWGSLVTKCHKIDVEINKHLLFPVLEAVKTETSTGLPSADFSGRLELASSWHLWWFYAISYPPWLKIHWLISPFAVAAFSPQAFSSYKDSDSTEPGPLESTMISARTNHIFDAFCE